MAGECAISVRPHEVELSAAPVSGENAFSGMVMRHTYLGAQRDYLVDMGGGITLRAVTPLETVLAVGATVGVRLPRRHCRALPR